MIEGDEIKKDCRIYSMVLKEMEEDLRRGRKLEGSGRKKLTKNKNERKS